MTALKQLLRKWADHEPDRCAFNWRGDTLVTLHGTRWWVVGVDEPPSLSRSLAAGTILQAVTEAIEARGWSWELTGSGCPSAARVTVGKTYGCVADEPTDPPVFALLGAYLAALKGEASE